MIPRNHVGKGVTGAVRYVLGEGRDRATGQPRTEPKGEQSRVAWIAGTGFGFAIESRDDADLARKVMEFTALNQGSKTKPCEKDCVHLSLGWRQGEQPSREQMIEAAHGALAALGMANARAIFVSHDDEQYPHLHVVASKINPDTGRAYDLKGDRLKLSAWAEKYERDFSGGIICTRREETNQLRAAIDRRDAAAVLDLMMQQRATFTARDLDRALGKQIRRPLQRAQFANDILAQTDAVRLTDPARPEVVRYTTRAVLEAEGQVLRAANALAAADRHAVDARIRKAVLESPQFDGITREQATAFRRCVEAGGLALIDGQAGTGKSYTISAIRQAYERVGYGVIGLGPTNAVAGDMRDSGFARAATIHSELFRLKNGRAIWTDRTAIILDEAAMIDTKLMAQVVQRAAEAGAKLIMLGDDRQLSSIDRGGMFGVLKDRHGAAELTQVRRQQKNDDRRAAELMAEGNFSTALGMYDTKGAIHWERSQDDAREALIEQWAKDTKAEPAKSRFVFAYTNADVDRLNAELRAVRLARGELPEPATRFTTKHGPADFSAGDRIQITGTDKERGLFNGAAGTVTAIDGTMLAFRLDGRDSRVVEIDTRAFPDFRHGYAGTIYKGQGRTLDQTYLYHSEHWRSASSYVALTRHRDKTELFVATNTAADLKTLARQMARVDDRRAASAFYRQGPIEPVRPVSSQDLEPIELPARRVVGINTVRHDPPAGPDGPPQGTADPATQAPRRRRERAEVGRDGSVARPEDRADDSRPAPTTGTSAITLPPANEQRRPMAEPEPPRKARRARAEVGRNDPPPAMPRDVGQSPGPSMTAIPASPENEADEQRTRSAVAGWTDQGGMVPQQDSAREAVRELTELYHRTPAPAPLAPAEMSPTPAAEPPQAHAPASGPAIGPGEPSPAEPAGQPAAPTQQQPDAARAADAASVPDAPRTQEASQVASRAQGDIPLSPREAAGSKAEAPSEAQSWQAAAREMYETVQQRAAQERSGRPANSPGRSGPPQGRGR